MNMLERRSESGVAIELDGEMTLACASELKIRLLQALESGVPVALQLDAVTEIDLACLQLLLAARSSFQARGVGLDIRVDPAGAVQASCVAAGLQRLAGG